MSATRHPAERPPRPNSRRSSSSHCVCLLLLLCQKCLCKANLYIEKHLQHTWRKNGRPTPPVQYSYGGLRLASDCVSFTCTVSRSCLLGAGDSFKLYLLVNLLKILLDTAASELEASDIFFFGENPLNGPPQWSHLTCYTCKKKTNPGPSVTPEGRLRAASVSEAFVGSVSASEVFDTRCRRHICAHLPSHCASNTN